jgi:hypothetical protein
MIVMRARFIGAVGLRLFGHIASPRAKKRLAGAGGS